MAAKQKKVSNWWYLVPILLSWLGALICWIALSDVNRKKAKELTILGLLMPIILVVIYFSFIFYFALL